MCGLFDPTGNNNIIVICLMAQQYNNNNIYKNLQYDGARLANCTCPE